MFPCGDEAREYSGVVHNISGGETTWHGGVKDLN